MTAGTPLDLTFARKLIEHAVWETRRVWQLAIEPLDEAQFSRTVAAVGRSIRDECLRHARQDDALLRALNPDFAALAMHDEADRCEIWRRWEAIGEAWLGLAGALEPGRWTADCDAEIDGEAARLKTWQVVLRFVYSGTACRSRILRLVADVHETPRFDLSLMQYLTGVFRS